LADKLDLSTNQRDARISVRRLAKNSIFDLASGKRFVIKLCSFVVLCEPSTNDMARCARRIE
jgi:hypothetical protein